MKLQTKVEIKNSSFKINFSKRGLIVGSCFADNFGTRLNDLYFNVVANPYGVMYNPVSVCNAVLNIKNHKQFSQEDLVYQDGLWHSWEHHGSFSNAHQNAILERINTNIDNDFDYIVITLGTAWVFKYEGRVVGNCHKVDSAKFVRQRLTAEQVFEQLQNIVNAYSKTKIIFTLSPIRHIKDGLEENSLSKATLRCAIGMICEKYDNCIYFPSYEIVMDELRDYRFYNEDMLHPTNQAVEYIFERFEEVLFDDNTKLYSQKIKKLNLSLNHRPLHKDSISYIKFVQNLDSQIEILKKEYKHLDDKEIFTNFDV